MSCAARDATCGSSARSFATGRVRREDGPAEAGGRHDPLEQAISEEQVQQVHAAVDALPERYRLPLVYAGLQELGLR